ncbi:MAG: type II toxin-antitoxin system VapC family toxin [Gemmataceae bacterium]|nr:type II toxin-antitoxin system VapC family toxin [Gemmataceae bacterium]
MIRLIEGDDATRAPLEARLAASLGLVGSLVTSRLTRLECRSKPLRSGDLVTLAKFELFFAGVELVLVEVGSAIIERATDLRAKYNLKTPDALHYATAVEVGATVFLTGDRGLVRCTEVPVEVL